MNMKKNGIFISPKIVGVLDHLIVFFSCCYYRQWTRRKVHKTKKQKTKNKKNNKQTMNKKMKTKKEMKITKNTEDKEAGKKTK